MQIFFGPTSFLELVSEWCSDTRTPPPFPLLEAEGPKLHIQYIQGRMFLSLQKVFVSKYS